MCNLNRKWMTLDKIEHLNVERFFEVGVGGGDVIVALGERGLHGDGIDLSEQAIQICQERIRRAGLDDNLSVHQGDLLSAPTDTTYDLVIAFEVLEHIEDDRAALEAIRALLVPDGYLLLSVPAHMSKWGATDVWAGHVRRYERDELLEKLHTARFTVRESLSVGYPLLNMTRHLRNLIYNRDLERNEPAEERTGRSGVSRPALGRLLQPIIPIYSWLVYQTQRPFLHSDMGEGYFVLAQRDE